MRTLVEDEDIPAIKTVLRNLQCIRTGVTFRKEMDVYTSFTNMKKEYGFFVLLVSVFIYSSALSRLNEMQDEVSHYVEDYDVFEQYENYVYKYIPNPICS